MSEPTAPTRPPVVLARSRFADAPSIYAALLLFGLTVGGVYLLLRLQLLLIILFMALLVASAIAGPVRRLERLRVPRALAILLVYAIIIALLGLLAWYALPRMLGQAASAAEDLPRRLQDLRELRLRLEEMGQEYPILRDIDTRLLELAERAGARFTTWLLGLPAAVAKTLFTLVSVFTIAFLLLITRERLLTLILSLIHPRHRATTQRVLAEMGGRLGAYVRAKLIVIVIVGSLVWAVLFFLDSPYAVLAAIFAGVTEVVPRIGPWFGRAAIFLAVLPLGWRAVAIAMVAHVVIENLKGQFISPLVESGQVDIHPLTAFIAIIVGGLLLGWLGALIAVPLAAVIQVLVEDVFIPWRHAQLAPAEAAHAIGPPAPEEEPDLAAPAAPVAGSVASAAPGAGIGDGARPSHGPAARA